MLTDLCVWQSERSRSHSPDTTASASASSIFDTSAGDASWATTATDVDADRAAAVTTAAPPVGLTREQAREVRRPRALCPPRRVSRLTNQPTPSLQKAQILRLRLSLASYKLRTGQTAVPLADLQPVPLPALPAAGASASRPLPTPEPEHDLADEEPAVGEEMEEVEEVEEVEEEEEETLPRRIIEVQGCVGVVVVAATATATPRRRRGDDGCLTSSALRGGAANGLLWLARGQGSGDADEEE